MRPITIAITVCVLISCQRNQDSPPDTFPCTDLGVRNAHAMAYHQAQEKIYLFGGATHDSVQSDLWTFDLDSARWQKVVTNPGPSSRTFASFAYEPESESLILFGGSKVSFGDGPSPDNVLGDTWKLTQGQWKLIPAEQSPLPRAEANLVYDPSGNRMILFGGYTIDGNQYIKLGDTWEFKNDTWALITEKGPSPRHGVVLFYDHNLERIVLFGGSTADRQYGNSAGETWYLEDNRWTKIEVEQGPGVFNPAYDYDTNEKVAVRFGGWDGRKRTDETWIFSNNQWEELPLEVKPDARNHSQMVYHEKAGFMVLFGGHDGSNVFGDTWKFENSTWRLLNTCGPIPRTKNGH